MRSLLKIVIVLLLVAGLGSAVWIWGALHFAYSDGERAGFVQKFSRKGWICKTWEGEAALVNLPVFSIPSMKPEALRSQHLRQMCCRPHKSCSWFGSTTPLPLIAAIR